MRTRRTVEISLPRVFLRLLKQLRIILLQDSVIMRKEYHPIWTDPVVGRDDYQAFTKDVELALLDA